LWHKDRSESVTAFIARTYPFTRRKDCAVLGCDRESATNTGLCITHDHRRLRAEVPANSATAIAEWVTRQRPLLGPHQFSLVGLPKLVRAELLYALQCRDAEQPRLHPGAVRGLVTRLDGEVVSLREGDATQVWQGSGITAGTPSWLLFRDLRLHLDRAWSQYQGHDPYAGEVWHVALLDLQVKSNRRYRATHGVIDFRPITLDWLRDIVKDWARTTRPYVHSVRRTIRTCQLVSHALLAAGRADPRQLHAGDFIHAMDTTSELRHDNGTRYSTSERRQMLYDFCQVIEHGRAAGLMTTIPDSFRPPNRFKVKDEPNEDELGKALPETVIQQLDAHLHLLGPTGPAGSFTASDLQWMHQTIYRILRDTGRRPGEIVSLHPNCIEIIDGHHNLIYDNHKAGRLRRRLPIPAQTADIILRWQQHRTQMHLPAILDQWLFPTARLRGSPARGHLQATSIAASFKIWMQRIGMLKGELLGSDGTPTPFDPSMVAPYSLRHSYAQRHADAGVAVDVLRDLMDHKSAATTMVYYRIGIKRKQQAIRTVGALAFDNAGKPAPFTDPSAYQRSSVAVPFGNCTEPSNVKAGGGSCPIRFQCAGCGFYRPDPSYLPALEQHIISLRSDRETAHAMGAATYVLNSLNSEIDAFSNVAEQMRRRLEQLDPQERDEVELASRLLRRARAARQLPIITAAPPCEPTT
jgi:integrase